VKGAWILLVHTYRSQMAQNFWTAIWAWCVCFAVTIAVSLVTTPKPRSQLVGLVYSETPHVDETGSRRVSPLVLGGVILAAAVALNILFR
jgi:SSS family solute:Na+ symporter